MLQQLPTNMQKVNPKIIVKVAIKPISVIVSAIGTPILLFLGIQCSVYKKCVTLLAKVLRRDLSRKLGPIDTLLADEDFNQEPSNCSIVAVLRVEGNLTLDQVITLFDDNVICAKIGENTTKRRYPELQQYPVDFMGYHFWKQDSNFCLANHITENGEMPLMPLSKIHQQMLNSEFPRRRSPWQLRIFRSGHQNRTYLAFRVHHCMSDARSIVKLLVECIGKKPLITKEAKFENPSIIERTKYLASLPLGLIRLNAKMLQHLLIVAEHPWKRQDYPKDISPFFVGMSGKIPLDKIKDTARVIGVQTSAVILTAVTSAVEKFLRIKNNYESETLPLSLALPASGHPSTLCNHLFLSAPDVPHVDDDIQRLRKYDRVYKYLKTSDHTKLFAFMYGLAATVPAPFRKVVSSIRVVTIGLSNIAGDQEGFVVEGSPCLGFTMSAGVVQGSIGVTFIAMSYKESLQVSVVAKSSILTERETVNLARMVEKEFLRLCQLVLG